MSEQREFYFFNNLVKQKILQVDDIKGWEDNRQYWKNKILNEDFELSCAIIYLIWLQKECFTPSYEHNNLAPIPTDDRLRFMEFFSFTILVMSRAANWSDGPDKDWKDQLLNFMVGHLATLQWTEITEKLLIDIYSLLYLKHLDKIKQ